MAVAISIATVFNVLLSGIEKLIFRGAIRNATLEGPPVFIVGHWRSGTTLLHELMVRDERFSSPSTFQCFAPSHFLVTEWFFRRFGRWLLPSKRPMDNMQAGWDRPQEDEFALLNLGMPSPYRRIAFPLQDEVDMDYFDFKDVSETDRGIWMETLRGFLHRVTIATARPLVIKSPTHTGRVGELAKAFPHAKFIHIVRDPRALFPSTCRLWNSLDEVQALQAVADREDAPQIQQYVIDCLRRVYESFHRDCDELDEHHLVTIRYEDLVADPVRVVGHIYETLRLADFETVADDLRNWAQTEHKTYQTNLHQLSNETEQVLAEQWSEYFHRYGYSPSST